MAEIGVETAELEGVLGTAGPCRASIQLNQSEIVSTLIDSRQTASACAHRSSIPPRRHAAASVARALAYVSCARASYEYNQPRAMEIA